MPLRDHFHPPLSVRRHSHAFHNAWATYLAADLNTRLPQGYFAEPNVQFGIEIDVATFEEPLQNLSGPQQGLCTVPDEPGSLWVSPAPMYTVPFSLSMGTVEVVIFNNDAGVVLTGAIELVSPANKDRPTHRQAFVSKCETYLQQGISVVVVDVVTGRHVNLHDALLARLGVSTVPSLQMALYAVAYRLVERDGSAYLDIWQEPLAVGQVLPTMPLWLRGSLCLPVVLDRTYERTCQEQRLATNGL